MKKFLFLIIIIFISNIIFSDTLYVPDDYNTIQEAVEAANSGDTIIIREGTWTENVDLDEFTTGTLTLQSTDPTDQSVVESTIVQATNTSNNAFSRTDFYSSADIFFKGITIRNSNAGIYIDDVWAYTVIYVENCILNSNTFGIKSDSFYAVITEYSHFYNNGIAINSTHNWVTNRSCIEAFGCLVYENGAGFVSDLDMSVEECTIADNTYDGVYIGMYGSCTIKNSIIYGNNNQINGNGTALVTYSCIEDGFLGIGNINDDPEFLDPSNDDYRLTWDNNVKSPCIDAGDPNSPLDPDDTRADMGAFYFEHEHKTYSFEGPMGIHDGWTWLCFDILDPTNAATNNQVQYLLDDIKENLDYGEHKSTFFYYTPNPYPGSWFNGNHLITCIKGYKIKMDAADEFEVCGQRYPETTPFDIDDGDWIGYFVDRTLTVYDAFDGYLDNINRIIHQDWSVRRSGTYPNYSWPDVNYTLSAGDMVIVYCDEDIIGFNWAHQEESMAFQVLEPENYSYTEEADYIPIYIELDENNLPDEIGVFVNDECKGARVVQHDFENICAYITDLQSGNIEIEFFYNGRGAQQRYSAYLVYDPDTGYRQITTIDLSEKKDYYYVSFNSGPTHAGPKQSAKFSISNFPNPFNPITTIFYNLPEEDDISLTVYNLKGQIVKELVEGAQPAGNYKVVWDGKNQFGQPVSSGIYYYRLEACGRTLHKKMLMLK